MYAYSNGNYSKTKYEKREEKTYFESLRRKRRARERERGQERKRKQRSALIIARKPVVESKL